MRIGTDQTGERSLPNALDGVAVTSAATGNFIGQGGAWQTSSRATRAMESASPASTPTELRREQPHRDRRERHHRAGQRPGRRAGLGQASGNFIGYAASGDNNVISGNGTWGVYITDAGTNDNTVANDFIGTDVAGKCPVPNNDNGVDIVFGAQGNTIGGTTAAARNVISGNLHEGVLIGFAGTANNVVEGNFIGTDVTGKAFLRNQQLDGVYVGLGAAQQHDRRAEPRRRVNTAAWNVISGNEVNGILVTDSGTTGTVISGNFIGTDVTGKATLPNWATASRSRPGPRTPPSVQRRPDREPQRHLR